MDICSTILINIAKAIAILVTIFFGIYIDQERYTYRSIGDTTNMPYGWMKSWRVCLSIFSVFVFLLGLLVYQDTVDDRKKSRRQFMESKRNERITERVFRKVVRDSQKPTLENSGGRK